MPATPTAEELYKYIGMAFEHAKSDPDLFEKLSNTPGVFKVLTTEPDGCMIIDIPNLSAVPGAADEEADAILRMTGEYANRFWQGDLNLTMAVMKGNIGMEGKMAIVAKAVAAQTKLFPAYIELLKTDGRTDLLVK
ncbi:SCP2 sterol-binding domain-containing protein [Rhodococcus opacus]|jgi:putative sterol carrier protein|uniref:SCP2 sterol-binding domain-containing protein n=1 Tax=Rhodococcus opacus TaxID=37919 RepID=UPI00146C5315|nr:SCP2 sterol-binding domain-containing protein [Rhodococcus opacus]